MPEFSRVISSDNLGMSTELSFSYGLGPVYGIPVFGFTTSLGSDKESSVGFCQDGGDILYSLEHKYLSETFLNSCTYAGMT